MALSNLADWNGKKEMADKGAACGTACGAKKPEKPASACGAGEPEKKTTACGSACGAGKPAEPEKKPAACGSACGAGGK